MAHNAKPILLWDNILRTGTLAATNTDPDSQYDVLNIKDWRAYTYWKASAAGTLYLTFDLNRQLDGGLESGTTGFTMLDATRSNAQAHSGSWSAELVGSGSPVMGPYSAYHEIEDLTWTYVISIWVKVTAYTSGTVALGMFFYDEDQNLIGTGTTYGEITQVQDWTQYTKTIGPDGEIAYPAGAKYFRVGARISMTATAYYDDFVIYREVTPDSLYVQGHNLWTAYADVSLEYSSDVTEVISTWTEEIAAFTPDNNKGFLKTFTGQASRAWRLKIVTSTPVVPYVALVVLGPRMAMERYPQRGFDPDSASTEVESGRSVDGEHLGAVVLHSQRKMSLSLKNISASWLANTFRPAWDSHIGLFKPFAFGWDITNHANEVYLLRASDDFRAPFEGARRSLSFAVEGKKE